MRDYKEYLKYEFSDTEIAEAARELAGANQKRASIEQRKKEIDSDLKAKIEEQNSQIQKLSAQISTGFEYRDISCRVELDTPEAGKKRIIRLDTGEEVKVILMTDQDRQMALDLAEKAEAEKPAEQPAPALQIAGPDGTIVGDGFVAEVIAEVVEDAPLASAREVAGGTHQKRRAAKEGK